MDFTDATNRATGTCITLEDVASAIGVAPQTVRRARMDQDAEHSRKPPGGWERALGGLARRRAADLVRLAEELEAQSEPPE